MRSKKRKLRKLKETDGNSNKKVIRNDKLLKWLRRCYIRRKRHNASSIENHEIPKSTSTNVALESLNVDSKSDRLFQSNSIGKLLNIQIARLKQSPIVKELESYDGSLINCTIQYGPDLSEDIHKSDHDLDKRVNEENHKVLFIKLMKK